MSSILKALKRLERDKLRRQDDNVDLARDILHGDGRRLGPPVWLLPLLVLVGVLLGATLLILVWPREEPAPSSLLPVSVPAAPVSIPQISEPAIVEEIIDRRRPVTAVVAPTVVRTEAQKVVPLNPVKAGVKSTAAPPPAADVPSIPGDNPAPAPAVSPVSEAAADKGLTVSAIVFSDDPASRLAVVNELPVMEGTMIGDSRVEEIRADRVIFTRGGMRFAVPFEPSSP